MEYLYIVATALFGIASMFIKRVTREVKILKSKNGGIGHVTRIQVPTIWGGIMIIGILVTMALSLSIQRKHDKESHERLVMSKRADRAMYPLFPLKIEVDGEIDLKNLDPKQLVQHFNLINRFPKDRIVAWTPLGRFFKGFNIETNGGDLSYQFYDPHIRDSFSQYRFLIDLIKAYDIFFVIAIYDKDPHPDTLEDSALGTIAKTLFISTSNKTHAPTPSIEESFIYYRAALGTVNFRLRAQVVESEVYKNKIIGISDLRNKYLRVAGFFNTSRDVAIKINYVSLIHGSRLKNSFFDFSNDKSIRAGTLTSVFPSESYIHKIKDVEINYRD